MGKKKRLMEKKRRESWPPASNGTIDKCIEIWKAMGHDVDRSASYVPGSPFRLVPVRQMYESEDGETDIWYAMDRIEFVLRKINAQAKKHGEEYEFKEIVKIVTSTTKRICSIITFNVREATTCVVKTVDAFMFEDYKIVEIDDPDRYDLRDWRFKSGCPEAPFEVEIYEFSEEEYQSTQYSYGSTGSDSDGPL